MLILALESGWTIVLYIMETSIAKVLITGLLALPMYTSCT
jgi:hypothetical protein